MRLQLNWNTRVREVKKAFHHLFPYLKLEFYSHQYVSENESLVSHHVPEYDRLIDVTGVMKEGMIDIEPDMTVSEVEASFQNRFGLPVQVYRRSNNFLWMEAGDTADLTLAQQNRLGYKITRPIYEPLF